jgi:hypothetical protein
MPAVTSLPTLSQVQKLDTTYLVEAQHYWAHSGNLWDQVFTKIHETMSTPGGTPWKGQASAAGQERAYVDMINVRGVAFQLHEAAGIAHRGDEQLQVCKEEVLDAVRDARAAGFEVDEDYSVTDRLHGGSAEIRAERLNQAEGHAAFIRHRVAALIATDQEISTQITAATEGIDNLTFHETPSGADDTIVRHDEHSVVQPVDHHWKQAPTPTPKPGPTNGPTADDIRRVLDKLPRGDQPWTREVRTPEDLQNLWKWMTRNGVDNPNRYGDSTKGEWKDLPDGTGIGQRNAAGSTKKPALDVRLPGQDGNTKVHINPRGGVPDIPGLATPAPPEVTEPGRAPVEPPPETPAPVGAPPLRGVPELPFGPGLTVHSPATGPHPVYGPDHHSLQPPLLGDEPDEVP